MNLRQKAVKGVGWSAVQNFGSQAVGLSVYLILARLLGPEVFGLVALASIFVAFVQVFQDQGLNEAIIQRQKLDELHLDTAFWTNSVMGLLLTLLGVIGSSWVALFFREPRLSPVICVLSLGFVIGSLSAVQQAILTRDFAFKALAARSLSATCCGGVVGIAMAIAGFGVWSLVGQQLTNQFIGLAMLWRASPWRPKLRVSRKHLGELLAFGANVTGYNLSNFFNRRSDDFLIGYFLGPVALGYYSIAYRILTVMVQLLTTTTTQVALPAFSQLQQQPERLRSAFYTVTQFTSLISFPIFLAVAALAPELVATLFGSKWTASVSVMQVLCLVGIQQSIFFFNSTVLMAMGKPSWRLWLNLLNSACGVVAFALAVRWGIVAVAAAYVLRVYLLSPFTYWAVDRLIHLDWKMYLRQFLPALAGSIALLLVITAIKSIVRESLIPYQLLLICSGASLGTYLFVLRFSSPNLFKRMLDTLRLFLPRAAARVP